MNSVERGAINLVTARLDTQNGQLAGKSVPWRLNQVLQATVVNSSPAGSLLQIEGKNYKIQSSSPVEPGKPLMLKVASLLPQIELVFIDTFRAKIRTEANPAAILSAQLLKKTQHAHKNTISKLLNFIKLINFSALQSLPDDTLSLLNSLKKKLIKAGELSDPGKLKPALRQSGLLLESKLASPENQQQTSSAELDTDLKAILFQIFKSLNRKPAAPTQAASQTDTQTGHGLSNYGANKLGAGSIKAQLMRQVEDSLCRIIVLQKDTLEESSEDRQRWFFELPVNFRSQLLSIPVTVYRDDSGGGKLSDATMWGAEFSLELQKNGFINAQVNITKMSVSVALHCELKKTAQYLSDQCDGLRESLKSCGLTLLAFESTQINSGQS